MKTLNKNKNSGTVKSIFKLLIIGIILIVSSKSFAQGTGNLPGTSTKRFTEDILVVNSDKTNVSSALRLQSQFSPNSKNYNDWVFLNDKVDRTLKICNWFYYTNHSEKDPGIPYFVFKNANIYPSFFPFGQFGVNILSPKNGIDVTYANGRTGSHPQDRPMYVTGDIDADARGIEFRHFNGTQGIGFGYNTIYATGSNTDQNLEFKSRGNGDLVFQTGSNTDMFIEGSNGRVGIGTITPQSKLEVTDVIIAGGRSNALFNSSANGTALGGYEGIILPGPTSQYNVSVQDGNGRIQHKWNATTGTNEKFLVGGEDASFIDWTGLTTNDPWIEFKFADGTNASAGDAITWQTHLAIEGNGDINIPGNLNVGGNIDFDGSIDFGNNLGIGTSSPQTELDVNGTIVAGGHSNTIHNSDENGTALDGRETIIMPGSDSQYTMSVQDGNGRIQHKWNATTGTNEKFLVAGEDASFIDWSGIPSINGDPWIEFKFADGSNASAGDIIPWQTHLAIQGDGHVGIGTVTPDKGKLHVNGSLHVESEVDGKTVFHVTAGGNSADDKGRVFVGSGAYDMYQSLVSASSYEGSNLESLNYRLWVSQGVVAEDYAISETSEWPDYVLNETYDLPTLANVENHIKKKGHLHTMPSAEEVESRGYTVDDMTKRMVKTIEELTLHTIEQEKKIDLLLKRIEEIEKVNNSK